MLYGMVAIFVMFSAKLYCWFGKYYNKCMFRWKIRCSFYGIAAETFTQPLPEKHGKRHDTSSTLYFKKNMY